MIIIGVAAALAVTVGVAFAIAAGTRGTAGSGATVSVKRLGAAGKVLVDAKGVSRLVSRKVGVWPFALLAVVGVVVIVVAILASPALQNVVQSLVETVADALGL